MLNIKDYHRPRTLSEAVALLTPGVTVIAGGTDLMVNPRYTAGVSQLVDVTGLGLAYIRRTDGWIRLGATTTMHEIELSPLLNEVAGGVLARAAGSCGSPNIRNVATLGGNVSSALPSGDTLTTLLTLDTVADLEGQTGRREVALADFFVGPARTVLSHELLVELRFPEPAANTRASFYKLGRTEEDISVVNVAALLVLDESGGMIQKARLAAGAVAPTPLRLYEAENFLVGQSPSEANLSEAARLCAEAVKPITDQRATADYRRKTTRVCAKRALRRAINPDAAF